MDDPVLLSPVRILEGPGQDERQGAVFIDSGVLVGFDHTAYAMAAQRNVEPTDASSQLIAPCLVDPHSILELPFSGHAETLNSLVNCASAAGFGQLALLPRATPWRDRPEGVAPLVRRDPDQLQVHLWGAFSSGGRGVDLAPHGDLLENGAVGLADDDAMIPQPLLERGLVLGEMGTAPVLIAPRDGDLQGEGMVREGTETLRAGWVPDPLSSESLPMAQLIALQRRHPGRRLQVMNISTADAVEQLRRADPAPMGSVCWWHLLMDNNGMGPCDPGWRVRPSLGDRDDRQALRQGLRDGTIQAISVHAVPLDEEDMLLPTDQRPPGLSGHHLVLPALWDALIREGGFQIRELWQALSFGPSAMLNQPVEVLREGSRRWLLFDPDHRWTVTRQDISAPSAANVPLLGDELQGRVIACGLNR